MSKTGNPLMVVLWHGKYFPLLSMARRRDVAIITNASYRGMIIGRICRWFGYTPIHLPVDGSANKVAFIKNAIKDGVRMLAIVPDGPLGPRHVVKNGSIRLATEVGFDILPLSVASSPKIVLNKRWDKHEIPTPFARVAIEIGERTDISGSIANASHETLPEKIARLILATDDLAEATLAGRDIAGN